MREWIKCGAFAYAICYSVDVQNRARVSSTITSDFKYFAAVKKRLFSLLCALHYNLFSAKNARACAHIKTIAISLLAPRELKIINFFRWFEIKNYYVTPPTRNDRKKWRGKRSTMRTFAPFKRFFFGKNPTTKDDAKKKKKLILQIFWRIFHQNPMRHDNMMNFYFLLFVASLEMPSSRWGFRSVHWNRVGNSDHHRKSFNSNRRRLSFGFRFRLLFCLVKFWFLSFACVTSKQNALINGCRFAELRTSNCTIWYHRGRERLSHNLSSLCISSNWIRSMSRRLLTVGMLQPSLSTYFQSFVCSRNQCGVPKASKSIVDNACRTSCARKRWKNW